MSYGRGSLDCKIYIGDLPKDATEKEIQRAFEYYGPVKSVWVARNPSGFAFVEMDEPRDAEDAVRALDRSDVCGGQVRVEFSTGKSKQKPWMRRPVPTGPPRRPFDPEDRCYECGQRGHYAYDCSRRVGSGGRRRSRSRSRSRSPRRSSHKSRSRSHSRDRHDRRGRDRSYSRSPRDRSVSRNRSPSSRRSPARSDK